MRDARDLVDGTVHATNTKADAATGETGALLLLLLLLQAVGRERHGNTVTLSLTRDA